MLLAQLWASDATGCHLEYDPKLELTKFVGMLDRFHARNSEYDGMEDFVVFHQHCTISFNGNMINTLHFLSKMS